MPFRSSNPVTVNRQAIQRSSNHHIIAKLVLRQDYWLFYENSSKHVSTKQVAYLHDLYERPRGAPTTVPVHIHRQRLSVTTNGTSVFYPGTTDELHQQLREEAPRSPRKPEQ